MSSKKALSGQRWAVTTAVGCSKGEDRSWKKIRAELKDAGAFVENIVHKKTQVLVASASSVKYPTQRVRKAQKFKVPICGVEYIRACIDAGQLLPPADFPVLPDPEKPKQPKAQQPTAPEQVAAAAAAQGSAALNPAAPAPVAAVKKALSRRTVFRRLLNFGALGLPQPRWLRDYQLSLALSHLRVNGRKRKLQRKQRRLTQAPAQPSRSGVSKRR